MSDKIIDEIKKMSVMDLVNLVKKIEDEFGVSAAAPVAAVAAAPRRPVRRDAGRTRPAGPAGG